MKINIERTLGRKYVQALGLASLACILSWSIFDVCHSAIWVAIPTTILILPQLLSYAAQAAGKRSGLKAAFLQAAIAADRVFALIPGNAFAMGLPHHLLLLALHKRDKGDLPGSEKILREVWAYWQNSAYKDVDRADKLAILIDTLQKQSKGEEARDLLNNLLVDPQAKEKIEGYERSKLRIFLAELNFSAASYEETVRQVTQAISDAHKCTAEQEAQLIQFVASVAVRLKRAGRFHEASTILRPLLGLKSVQDNCLQASRLLLQLTEVLGYEKNYRQAECLIEEFLHNHCRDTQDDAAYALNNATTAMVQILNAQKRYDDVLTFIEGALKQCRDNGGNLEYEAGLLTLLMGQHSEQGRYETAAAVAEELSPYVSKIKVSHPARAGKLLITQCLAFRNIGRWEDALIAAKESVDLIQHSTSMKDALVDLSYLTTALNNLGVLYYGLAMYDEALSTMQRSLALRLKTSTEPAHIASAQSNVGLILSRNGKLEEADKVLLEARVNCDKSKLPEKPVKHHLDNNTAYVWLKQGRLDEAQKLLEEIGPSVQELGHKKGGQATQEEYFRLLGMLYAARGDFEKSEGYFKQSLDKIHEDRPCNARSLSETLEEYAAMLQKAGRSEESHQMMTEAQSVRPRLKVPA
jgi:tetratricopeptide (TPR) repeat protein